MFIAVYEFKVIQGRDEAFRSAWLKLTEGIYQSYGSRGSRLHISAQPNMYVAYAQWPSRDDWANPKGALPAEFDQAKAQMMACLESSKTVYELEVTDDFLQHKPFEPKDVVSGDLI